VVQEMHTLATASKTLMSDDDHDLDQGKTSNANILKDINTLVSDIHMSLRLQNLSAQPTSTQYVLPGESLEHNIHSQAAVSQNYSVHSPESDSVHEHGVVHFDIADFKSHMDYSDIQDSERQSLISEWLIRSDEIQMKIIRTLYYQCRWKNENWPHTDILSEKTLASILRHFIEPEEKVPIAEEIRVLAIPTPSGLGNTAPKHAYRGTVKKILTRKSSHEQIIEILFDVGVRGYCILNEMVKHISSVCPIYAEIQLKNQLFGVRVGNSAFPDALAIGKFIRFESIEGVDVLVLAIPLHGIATRNSTPMDGSCGSTNKFSYTFPRVFDIRYNVAGRDLSAGFMDGEYCFQSLVHFTLVCTPLKILDGEFIHQLDFVTGYDEGNYGYWQEHANDFKREHDTGLHFVLVYVAKEA